MEFRVSGIHLCVYVCCMNEASFSLNSHIGLCVCVCLVYVLTLHVWVLFKCRQFSYWWLLYGSMEFVCLRTCLCACTHTEWLVCVWSYTRIPIHLFSHVDHVFSGGICWFAWDRTTSPVDIELLCIFQNFTQVHFWGESRINVSGLW